MAVCRATAELIEWCGSWSHWDENNPIDDDGTESADTSGLKMKFATDANDGFRESTLYHDKQVN